MDSTGVLFSIFAAVILLLVIGAIAYFFYDDRNRVKAITEKTAADNEVRRAILGEFADIELGQMTPDVEAQMTQEQKKLWADHVVLLRLQKKEEDLALDLFGPGEVKRKLNKLLKMVGVATGILAIWFIGLAIDDAFGFSSIYHVPKSIIFGVGSYLLYIFVMTITLHHTVKRRNKA